MAHRVLVPQEVIDDINAIADQEVRRAAAKILVALRGNAHLGQEMYARGGTENLEGARKIRFDKEGWHRKPRFRLVYENRPHDGRVVVLIVLAVGRRDDLRAYRIASGRRARLLRKHLKGS